MGGGGVAPEPYGGGHHSTNLGDILERVLDKGLVIAGDIQVNLLDIELLTIKLRLVIASLETAKAVGINWWEHDPWLSGTSEDLELENRRLRERVAELESGEGTPAVDASGAQAEPVSRTASSRKAVSSKAVSSKAAASPKAKSPREKTPVEDEGDDG